MKAGFQIIQCALGLAVLLTLSAVSVAAQGGSIQGRLVLPSGANLYEATRITLQTSRGVKATVFTDNQGQFVFRSITPGLYEVVVDADKDRFEIATANVEVFPNAPSLLTITLKEKKSSESKNASNSVSATELDQAVPAKARKEFERAGAAAKEQKTEEAIAHLRKAIEYYPSYLMARNDLGTQLLAQGKLDEAAEELRRAMKIDPKAFNPKLNLGIVLVQQHMFSEAAAELKEAISLNSASPSARLYNGIALAALSELEAAEKELTISHELGGTPFALALFHLANLYLNKGDRKRAAEALESYLREAPNAANAPQARALLRTIR